MLRIGDTEYEMLLLDTNFLTRLFDQPEARARRLISRIDTSSTVFAITLYTLMEVRDRPQSYRKLLAVFAALPLVIMKSFHQLFAAEMAAYPEPERVDPILFAPVGIQAEPSASQEDAVRAVLENPGALRLMDEFRADRRDIVNNMLGLRSNFPKPPGGYTREDVREFVWKVCFQQAASQDLEWVESMGGADFELDPAAFLSMKAMIYSTFYRFYTDLTRKPRRSDAFDIASASALPYVDQAALEKNQADIVRNRVSQVDSFLDDLRIWTFRDLAA